MRRLIGVVLWCVSSIALGQSLSVTTANSPVTIASAATYAQVTVDSGATLYVDAPLTVTGDMSVSGLVTLSGTSGMTLQLSVAGTLTVELGGAIDVSGKGLKGAPDAGFGDRGASLDPSTYSVIAGSGWCAGGSHASVGVTGLNAAPAASVYGALLTLSPGGGGGRWIGQNAASRGGTGGGIIDLVAGTLMLRGQLRADGQFGVVCGGGGAGGSISLKVGTLSGAGTVSASGGPNDVGDPTAGAGGAGRIKATLTTWNFGGRFEVLQPFRTGAVQTGTTHVVDALNRFYLVTPAVFRGGENFEAVLFKSDASLRIEGAATIKTPLIIPAANTVTLASPSALDAMTIATVDGRLEVTAKLAQAADLLVRGTLIADAEFTVQNLETDVGAVITQSITQSELRLNATDLLHIAAGAQVRVTGLGAPPGGPSGMFGFFGATYDPLTGTLTAGSGDQNGGSHAGLGGKANGSAAVAAIYDSPDAPRHPGGGGGGAAPGATEAGGAGGGVARLSANRLQVDGVISAEGAIPFLPLKTGAPGAGGTIVATVGSLTGTGTMSARGGKGNSTGAGGGGGIIRLVAGSVANTVTLTAVGGTGAYPGGDGVVSQALSAVKITSVPPPTVTSGQLLTYPATASGAAPITWALLVAPAGATVSTSGQVTWPAVSGAPQTFSLQATNAAGTDVQNFTVSVIEMPVITSTPNSLATLGVPYLYDADGKAEATGTGPLTWSVVAGPAGLSIEAGSGALTWSPSALGSYPVCLRASNAAGEVQQCFAVTVASGPTSSGVDGGPSSLPSPPTFTSSPSTTAFCGVPYHYSGSRMPVVQGSGPLTFTLEPLTGTVLPSGLTVDPMTGAITWTPSAQDVGAHPVVLTVQNNLGQDAQTFAISVECRDPNPAKVGCSCASPGGATWWALVLGWLAVQRRISRSHLRAGV